MASISIYNPRVNTSAFTNQPSEQIGGDILMLNVLIELRVLSELIVMQSNGVAIKDDLQKLRIDQANSPV